MEVCLVDIYCVQKISVSNLDVNIVILPGLWALLLDYVVVHFGAGRSEGGDKGGPQHNSHEAAGGRKDDRYRQASG